MAGLRTIVPFLVLINSITSQVLPYKIELPKTKNNNESISKCILQLFKKYIPRKDTVFIVSSNNYHESLLRPIHSYNNISVVTRSFDEKKWLVYADTYLIVIRNINDFSREISELSNDLSWNPTSKFIIIWKDMKDNTSEIFELLMENNIFNVIIITMDEIGNLILLTYYPYSGSNCGHNPSDIRSLGYCKDLNVTVLFPNKFPNGLRKCTLVVVAREIVPYVIYKNNNYSKYLDIGLEQYMLNNIAKQEGINLEYKYVAPKDNVGVPLPNKTIPGIFGYLQRGEADIIIGGLILSIGRIEMFDFIHGYNYALLSILTPVLREQKWAYVYQQFSVWTWMLIIFTFVFTTTIISVTISLTSGKSNDYFLVTLKLWRYFYGEVDDNLFRNKYLTRLMIVWILFTSSICSFYNTAMYSLITGNTKDETKIDPSNLASLPFKPCLGKDLRTYFSFAYNETLPESDNSPQCQNIEEAFEVVASRTDFYTIVTDYLYLLRQFKYQDSDGKSTMNKWDYPINLVAAIYTKKGFPLRDKFTKYAHDIYENGLLKKHLALLLAKNSKNVLTLKKKYNPLCLEDLKIHFSVVIIGVMVSLISFVIELRVGN